MRSKLSARPWVRMIDESIKLQSRVCASVLNRIDGLEELKQYEVETEQNVGVRFVRRILI